MNISQLVQDVIDGNEDPLKAYVLLYDLGKEVEKAITYIKDYAVNEAGKEQGPFERYGKKIQFIKGGISKYDFSKIGNWKHKKEELEEIEDYYKKAYHAHKSNITMVDPNGEILVLPEVSYKSDYITIK